MECRLSASDKLHSLLQVNPIDNSTDEYCFVHLSWQRTCDHELNVNNHNNENEKFFFFFIFLCQVRGSRANTFVWCVSIGIDHNAFPKENSFLFSTMRWRIAKVRVSLENALNKTDCAWTSESCCFMIPSLLIWKRCIVHTGLLGHRNRERASIGRNCFALYRYQCDAAFLYFHH